MSSLNFTMYSSSINLIFSVFSLMCSLSNEHTLKNYHNNYPLFYFLIVNIFKSIVYLKQIIFHYFSKSYFNKLHKTLQNQVWFEKFKQKIIFLFLRQLHDVLLLQKLTLIIIRHFLNFQL
jgi:hypothetical protein